MLALAGAGGAILAAAANVACSTPGTACTPETFGLATESRIVPEVLAQIATGCEAEGASSVVRSDEELSALRARTADAGTAIDAGAPIDFATESIVVLEHDSAGGIAWAAVVDQKLIIGLQGCASATQVAGSCTTDVVRVRRTVTSAETRTCDPVTCRVPNPI